MTSHHAKRLFGHPPTDDAGFTRHPQLPTTWIPVDPTVDLHEEIADICVDVTSDDSLTAPACEVWSVATPEDADEVAPRLRRFVVAFARDDDSRWRRVTLPCLARSHTELVVVLPRLAGFLLGQIRQRSDSETVIVRVLDTASAVLSNPYVCVEQSPVSSLLRETLLCCAMRPLNCLLFRRSSLLDVRRLAAGLLRRLLTVCCLSRAVLADGIVDCIATTLAVDTAFATVDCIYGCLAVLSELPVDVAFVTVLPHLAVISARHEEFTRLGDTDADELLYCLCHVVCRYFRRCFVVTICDGAAQSVHACLLLHALYAWLCRTGGPATVSGLPCLDCSLAPVASDVLRDASTVSGTEGRNTEDADDEEDRRSLPSLELNPIQSVSDVDGEEEMPVSEEVNSLFDAEAMDTEPRPLAHPTLEDVSEGDVATDDFVPGTEESDAAMTSANNGSSRLAFFPDADNVRSVAHFRRHPHGDVGCDTTNVSHVSEGRRAIVIRIRDCASRPVTVRGCAVAAASSAGRNDFYHLFQTVKCRFNIRFGRAAGGAHRRISLHTARSGTHDTHASRKYSDTLFRSSVPYML